MTTDRANDLRAFIDFATASYTNEGANLTLDEALARWEHENAPEEEREETIRAIREGLDDMYAGRVHATEDVFTAVRQTFGFGQR